MLTEMNRLILVVSYILRRFFKGSRVQNVSFFFWNLCCSREIRTERCRGNLKKRNHLEYLGVVWRIILNGYDGTVIK